jgi:hypothetical protein
MFLTFSFRRSPSLLLNFLQVFANFGRGRLLSGQVEGFLECLFRFVQFALLKIHAAEYVEIVGVVRRGLDGPADSASASSSLSRCSARRYGTARLATVDWRATLITRTSLFVGRAPATALVAALGKSRTLNPAEPPPRARRSAASGQLSGEVVTAHSRESVSRTTCSVCKRFGSVGLEPGRAVDSVMAVAWIFPNELKKSTAPSLTVRTAMRLVSSFEFRVPSVDLSAF